MDIHPPQGPVHSVKEFLIHLSIVTIGIVIALSLEGVIEWRHHRVLARDARSNLASEIRLNEDRLRRGLAAAPDAEQRLQKTIETIQNIRKGASKHKTLEWGFGVLPLSVTAWSTAMNTGAVNYLDYSEVQAYTKIYLLQDQFLSIQQRTLDKWLDLQKWAEQDSGSNDLSSFNPTELSEIKNDAASALVHTRTEESFAKALLQEYSSVSP